MVKAAKRSKPKAAAEPERDRAVEEWECSECAKLNAAEDPQCRNCPNKRWDLIGVERAIVECLLKTTEAKETWRGLRASGATDQIIHLEAVRALGSKDGHTVTTEGPACWVINNDVIGFWPDEAWPSKTRPPMVEKRFLEIVRDVFRIPQIGKSKDPDRGSLSLQDDEPSAYESEVSVEAIDSSPLNPRAEFDQAALQELADSLRNHGQLQNVVLWIKHDGRYELIGGERRWRAAKLAGLKTLRARILRIDETRAIELRGIENLVRVDLTAIETARWYQQLIDRCGYTQQALADRLGCTQGNISNRLRLLKLPEEWQQRVISQEITEAHARELVPWCDLPTVLDAVAERLKSEGETPTVKEWKELVESACEENSREATPGAHFHYCVETKRGANYFNGQVRMTAEEFEASKESLNIRDVPQSDWQGKVTYEPRAFNIELWQKMQAAAESRFKEQEASKVEKAEKAKPGVSAADRKKVAKAKQQQDRRIFVWRTRWYQTQLAERLAKSSDLSLLIRCALHFAVAGEYLDRQGELRGALEKFGGKPGGKRRKGYTSAEDVWKGLCSVPATKTTDLLRSLLVTWWQHDAEGYHTDVDPDDVADLAEELGVDLKKHWTVTSDFLELFTKDQLWALATEWGVTSNKAWIAAGKKEKRTEVIDALLKVDQALTGAKKRLPTPKCLLEAKGV